MIQTMTVDTLKMWAFSVEVSEQPNFELPPPQKKSQISKLYSTVSGITILLHSTLEAP